MERVKSVPARPRWRWRERAHAAMRSTIGGGAALSLRLSLRYFGYFCYFGPRQGYIPRKAQVRMRTERHVADVWGVRIRRSCIDPFLDRSHSRNIIRGRTQPRSSPTNYNRGRVTVNRVEHRALGLAVACTVTVLAQLISDTWVPSWGPLLTSCGLVQRHRSPHNRMPRVPLALPVASYLSPPIVSSGSARLLARQHRVVARPQPHAVVG